MTTYTVAQLKGGSGKSVIAPEFAAWLAARGRRVLMVELEAQGHSSNRLGFANLAALPATMASVVDGDLTMEQAAQPSPTVPGVDVLAGTHAMTSAGEADKAGGRIARIITSQCEPWDDLVIDTPGSKSALTVAGLIATDHLIVPCPPTIEAWTQIGPLEDLIHRRVTTPGHRDHLSIGSIVPTLWHSRSREEAQVLDRMRTRYAERVTPPVRYSTLFTSAISYTSTLGAYRRSAPAVADLEAAFDHILTR